MIYCKMAQHFLLSSRAKTLSLAQVFRLSDAEAEAMFRQVRWAETRARRSAPSAAVLMPMSAAARPVRCASAAKPVRAISASPAARCSTITSCRSAMYLAAIAVFCNEVKGKSMVAMSRDLGLAYKSAFVLCHKMREAMAEEMKGRVIGDDATKPALTARISAATFARPISARHRVDRRLWKNQNGKRKVVVVIREHGGETLPGVFASEGAALSWIKSRVVKGTTSTPTKPRSWNGLHDRFEVKRINHQEAYSLDGACTNWAESYFARLRRGEAGHHHHIAGPYLLRFAQEAAWREDNRRVSNGDQVRRVAGHAAASRQVSGFQRVLAAAYHQQNVATFARALTEKRPVDKMSIPSSASKFGFGYSISTRPR